MSSIKLLLSFAPWLAFLFIAHGSLFRLKLGLVVALVLSVVMGVLRLHRGIILWLGLLFFSSATIAVAGFENAWVMRHMGILASGALAAGTWLTIALGEPFTLDYAREHVDPSRWSDPLFIRTNLIIASVWGLVFTVNALLAWGKMEGLLLPELGYELVSYSLLVGTVLFTTRYPEYVRRRAGLARA